MEETTGKAEQASGHGPSLEVTAQRLAQWREVRRRGERIPPALPPASDQLSPTFRADDPRRSDTKCKEINIHQSS